MEPLSSKSAWSADEVEAFLSSYRAPVRIAVQTGAGFPMLCSLWFLWEDGRLLCATHRNSRLVEHLGSDSRCAFELAPNEPPYFGVRGHGFATIRSEGAEELLGRLIDRFTGDRDSRLARWLMSRAADEVCVSVEPKWLTSWDYRERMNG